MTTGIRNRDAFTDLVLDSGPGWVGVKDLKTWSGGDKLVRKLTMRSPRAPKAPFLKRPPGVPSVPYKGKKPKKKEILPRVPYAVPAPSAPRRKTVSSKVESSPAPYEGRETIRWSDLHRLEQGALPNRASEEFHDYTMSWRRLTSAQGVSIQPGFGAFSGTPFQYGMGPVVSHTPREVRLLKVLGKLREKVAGSDFNFGVSLGEAPKALQMIGSAATRIFSAYSHTRKGDLVGAAKALGVSPRPDFYAKTKASRRLQNRLARSPIKGTSNSSLLTRERFTTPVDPFDEVALARAWLELQYGWLPLLKDVQGGAVFLAHHLNVPLREKIVSRTVSKSGITSAAPTVVRNVSASARSTCQIIAYVTEKDVAQLAGLQDVSSIAWELTPFSFVADWFIPIGSWLSARGLAHSLTGTYITTYTERHQAVGLYSLIPSHTVPGEASSSEIILQRRVSLTLSVPLPQSTPLGEVFSWKRAANSVALLISGFSTRPGGLSDRTD